MAVEDTDTSATVDTSTDEPVQLEDMEVTEEELAEINEPSEELETEEVESPIDETETDTESEPEVVTEEEESDTEVEETPPKQSDEERKAYNKMMAEKRIQEKAARDAEIAAKQQEYVTEAESDDQAALRQLQVDAYNTRTEGLTNKLTNGYEKALKDFPILSDQTLEIQAEVADAIDAFQAKYVKIDSFGNPAEVKGDLYQYLQNKAESIERLTAIGARKQVDSKVKEKSKTFTPPSRVPKEPKSDPELDAFWEAAGIKH